MILFAVSLLFGGRLRAGEAVLRVARPAGATAPARAGRPGGLLQHADANRRGSAVRKVAGVRDGAGETQGSDRDGHFGDYLLDSPGWKGSAGTLHTHIVDDLEPTAPLDGVDPPPIVSVLSPDPLPAEHHNSKYVESYRNPDAFPVAKGPPCNCELPPEQAPTEEQMEWSREVAKQLGIRESQLPTPSPEIGHIRCTCDGKAASLPHHWSKIEAIPGTNNFTISPADSTYPNGDYWQPIPRGGLVAPADVMPDEAYPLQAPSDKLLHVPATAREDRVGLRFARYIDQVEFRSRSCEGDEVSKRCITPCRPGDKVLAKLGMRRVKATVVSTHINGALIVEYKPEFARRFLGAVACPLAASCSTFRPCRQPGRWCVEQEGVHSRDYLGKLELVLQCPPGTQVCRSVQQAVSGRFLVKDGRHCKAAPALVAPP